MKMNRRKFLTMGAVAGAVLLVPSKWAFGPKPAKAFYQTPVVSRFVQPLRGVYPIDPNGIPVAMPDGTTVSYKNGAFKVPHYTIDINQFQDQLHPEMGPTILWGFHSSTNLGGAVQQRHLGGILVVKKNQPIQITFKNNLPATHILPVDNTIMGATEGLGLNGSPTGHNRTSVHLHGGDSAWQSDGGPFAWFDPYGNYGSSVKKGNTNLFKTLNKNLNPGEAEYYYTNAQSARMAWYHDHAVGITRLNAYAGIASAYIIRDDFEASLVANKGLPQFIEAGGNEIPLVIQEKIFVGDDIDAKDPTWKTVTPPSSSAPGSLWYAHTYEERWGSVNGSTQPEPSAIPEFFGDTMLVNGVVQPYAAVEPRRYRLRILNATQARFLNLQLYEEDAKNVGNIVTKDVTVDPGDPTAPTPIPPVVIQVPDTTRSGPNFLAIGTEGGFLAFPTVVPSNKPMTYLADGASVDPAVSASLLTAPGERWDVIVDFKGFAGKKFILYNDAPAPFPGGDPINDYNNPKKLNTRAIMRFDVASAITGPADPPLKITSATPLALDPKSGIKLFPLLLSSLVVNGKINKLPGIKVRRLTLNEVFDAEGRLIQMLGTNQPAALPGGFTIDPVGATNYARAYDDPATENVTNGTWEIWEIANLTMDTHPMHFHLVNVLVLGRQSFTDALGNYQYANGVPNYTGPAVPPPPSEWGWKETVKMNPGTVTTVIMKFELPNVPFEVKPSFRTGGNEYVWHCHILEHEEHDMMRPLIVK